MLGIDTIVIFPLIIITYIKSKQLAFNAKIKMLHITYGIQLA